MILPNDIPQILYPVVMGIAVLGWVALIVFPYSPKWNFWFAGLAVPLTLCLFYIVVLLMFWYLPPRPLPGDFLTLARVHRMFTNSGLLLGFWISILAMDLVAGAWMTRKAAQTKMPRYLLLPCLIMTFVFAGVGFALFSVVASVGGRWAQIADVEEVPALDSQPVTAVVS